MWYDRSTESPTPHNSRLFYTAVGTPPPYQPRQRFDPTDPEGVMGLAHSAKRSSSGGSSPRAGGKGKGRGSGDEGGDDENDDADREEEEEEEEEEVWEREEDVLPDAELAVGTPGSSSAMSDVCIVVDSGFSFTHILPFYQGRALHKSVRLERGSCGGRVVGAELS